MRLEDWETRLLRVLEGWAQRESVWGSSDCSFFIADAVAAVTGQRDPFAIFRGKYDDYTSAEAVVLQAGFEDLQEFVAAQFKEIPTAMAHRGDIGFVPQISPMCMCVVMGSVVVYTAHDGKGLTAAPRSRLIRAFKVGWNV